MLALKIMLTITIITGMLSLLMVIADSDGRHSRRFKWWPTIGGLAIITTMLGISASGVTAVWQFLP